MKQQKINKEQNKVIIFDSGTLISFSMNGLTYLLRRLKEKFSGKFIITYKVKKEVIDTPLNIKRFELEAIMIRTLLDEKILELPDSLGFKESDLQKEYDLILQTANSTFSAEGRDIHIVDIGEASCIALSKILNERGIKNVIALDERTTRLLIERPENLKSIFEGRMNTKVTIKEKNAELFRNLKVIRSTELSYVAYKKGLVDLKGKEVLDGLLYALKSKGAAISGDEIEEIKRIG